MGVMGAGLAKQIRTKWPAVYTQYKNYVDLSANKRDLLGHVSWLDTERNPKLYIASIFGQYAYGHGARFTNYPALLEGLSYIFGMAIIDKLPVYIPKGIGCGLAGGEWKFVEDFIRDLDAIQKDPINIFIVEKEFS